MTTNSLMELVTDLIIRLETGRLEAGFSRPMQRGSAQGRVSVEPDPYEQGTLLLVVRLEIMRIPDGEGEAFFRRLLELNHRFQGRAAFSLGGDGTVSLTAGRSLEDLDPGEVVDLILWTSEQADHHDDLLLQEFRDR